MAVCADAIYHFKLLRFIANNSFFSCSQHPLLGRYEWCTLTRTRGELVGTCTNAYAWGSGISDLGAEAPFLNSPGPGSDQTYGSGRIGIRIGNAHPGLKYGDFIDKIGQL